ncbi:MAG: alpha/beta hydrolase-fold protein [Myxococcota bacterium]
MAVVVLEHRSAALAHNPLGDPFIRKLPVIFPDDLSPGEAVPCLWWLAGYAGTGQKSLSHDPWEEGLEERLIRLRSEGQIGKLIVALPDAFTKYGGSQYLSSSAHGDYETYLGEELPAEVEARFRISRHGIAGKSSGGFGALIHAMRRPERFTAVACHSGDLGFRLAYLPDLPLLLNAIVNHGSVEAFVRAFDAALKKKDGRWFGPMSVLGMAAAYAPDPSRPLGIELPFTDDLTDVDEARFQRWLAHDPVRLVDDPEVQANLRKLRLLYLDCGRRDEHHLHFGARALARKLQGYGVPHQHEEFDDGHRSTSYRLDVSLPLLYQALVRP